MLFKSQQQNVAIIGINRETSELLSMLLDAGGVRVLRVINHEYEDLADLRKLPHLDIIINTTNDSDVVQKLKSLGLRNAEIIGGLSARILFLSGVKDYASEQMTFDRARILNSLYEIKQAVLLSKNKEELLKLFLHVAMGTCNADTGSIMLLDSQKRFLKIEMSDGLSGEVVKSTVQKLGKGIAGRVARTGKPVLLKGTVENAEKGEAGRFDLTSSICCPIVIRNEVVGVLNVNSKQKGHDFTERDLSYIKELTDFTADVIKTSKEFDRTATESFTLSLVSAAQDIFNLPDYPFEERLNLLLLKIANTYNAVICNYYQYFDETRMFLALASNSFNRDLLKGKRIKLNDAIASKVLEKGQTVCLDADEPLSSGRKLYIAHPIFVNKRLDGLLFLHFVSARTNVSEDVRTLEKVGDLVALELGKIAERSQLRMQSTKLSAVSEASFNIASATTLRDLVNFVLPNACLIMEAEAAVFWLLNPVSDRLDLYSSFTIDNPDRLRDFEKLDAAILDKTVPGDDALLIADLRKQGYVEPDKTDYPRSLLSKIFGRGGQVAAAFSLYGKKSLDMYGSRAFTPGDKEVFLKFCLQFNKGLAKLMPYFDEKR